MGTLHVPQGSSGTFDARAQGGMLIFKAFRYDYGEDTVAAGGVELGLEHYFPVEVLGVIAAPQDGYVFEYDRANDKLIAYEVGDDEGAVAGPLEEATGDLSDVTGVQILAWGH